MGQRKTSDQEIKTMSPYKILEDAAAKLDLGVRVTEVGTDHNGRRLRAIVWGEGNEIALEIVASWIGDRALGAHVTDDFSGEVLADTGGLHGLRHVEVAFDAASDHYNKLRLAQEAAKALRKVDLDQAQRRSDQPVVDSEEVAEVVPF